MKDLFLGFTNPRPATSLDDLSVVLEAWDTNLRLFAAAGGVITSPDQKFVFVHCQLPPDISAYVTMHMELPQYSAYRSSRPLP